METTESNFLDFENGKEGSVEFRQIITTDITIEALGTMLNTNPHGVGVIKDELIGWLKGMNQYRGGAGEDMEKFLSCYSRAPFYINRKSSPFPLQIDSPFVTVIGGLQNDLLPEIAKDKNTGFIDRILLSAPERIPARSSEHEISDEVMKNYRDFIVNMHHSLSNVFKNDIKNRIVVRFSENAYSRWKEWHKSHCAEMNNEMPYYLQGAWSKLEAYTARFCLLLERLRCADKNVNIETISLESIEGAIKLSDYFKAHARIVYDLMNSSDMDKKVAKAVAWIKKQGGTVTSRKLYSYKVAGCKNYQEAADLFAEMCERRIGEAYESKTANGKMKTTFRLKPVSHNNGTY
jgi:hypothetical protein